MTLADQIANLGYPVGMGMAPHPDAVARMRNSIIEECARVAQEFRTHAPGTAWIMDEIADAIRALMKDKP